MKKTILAAALTAFAAPAFCHPAKSIDIQVKGTSVTIAIVHQVKDAKTHFIDDVDVSVNGVKMISQKYKEQADSGSQSAVYVIPGLSKGDKIKVSTDCNKGGKLEKEITVQ